MLSNAEIIRNPFNVDFHTAQQWPEIDASKELRLACVGTLHPPSKGQDILLNALSGPLWDDRNWRLTLYGNGPMREILERMSMQLNISHRVSFGGYIAPEEIWATNHALVMPSRYEGMPLATVEAMLCGRSGFSHRRGRAGGND